MRDAQKEEFPLFRLILGRAGSGKTAEIMQEINRAVSIDRRGLVLLVPEQYSHEAERELCRVCGDRLCLCAEVLSFSRMCSRVFDELGVGGIRYLDKGGRLLSMSLAISTVAPRLRAYSSAQRTPELQEMLLDAVTELKTACVSSEMLEAAAESADKSLAEKLMDLAIIFEAYTAITSRGSADPSDKLTSLAEMLPESIIGEGGIFIDGFTDFTAQEVAIIGAFLDRGVDVTVCLTCDTLKPDGAEFFDASRRAALSLLRMAKDAGHECKADTMEQENSLDVPALVFLEKHLFAYTKEKCEDTGGAIKLYSAQSVIAECELAAARALELVRVQGCRWRDIAVAVRGFDEYQGILESIFSHYGVPLYSSGKSDVMKKPVPAMISSVFEILSGGWESGDILSYLKTGLVGLSRTDCDILENYLFTWGIRGASMWTREKPWSAHPDGFSAAEDETSREKLERINEIRAFVAKPLAGLMETGKTAETAAEHAAAVAKFLEDVKLAGQLNERAAALDERGEQTVAMEYRQLWEILVTALEQCAGILGDTHIAQGEFGRLLCLVLSQYDVGTIPIALDMVSAGDMDRMRRRHIKHLIILGAADDRLPQTGDGAGIFSDDERELLSGLGLGLGEGRADSMYRELCLIYNCLTLPSETLTVSYPSSGGEGSQRRPSMVMHRLASLTAAEIKPFEQKLARTSAVSPAMELAACAVNGMSSDEGQAALEWLSSQAEFSERIQSVSRAARLGRGGLSRKSVDKLYGENLRLSASRVDTFSSCRFKYFLQYGLRARERKRARFDPPEMGTFMHYVLEGFTKEVMENGGFKKLDSKLRDQIAEKYVEKYISEVLDNFSEKSPRFIYLFRRLVNTVKQIAADMAEELSRSDFVPIEFELDFSGRGDLPPVTLGSGDGEIALTGIADRIDGWFHEDKLYLRVVDYKTGKKKFDFTDVYNGMGLQMLLYLFALTEIGMERYGKAVVPAGVLYAPARDVVVKAAGNIGDEKIAEERAKSLLRSGLILEDESVIAAMENGEQPKYLPVKFKDGKPAGDCLADIERFAELSRHIKETLSDLAEELHSGSISANPYYRGSAENACLYCEFLDACHFDDTKDKTRYVQKLKASEFWEKLGERGAK